ncbi:MAG: LysM peptidoglycan-binding domain-containing protein [Halanaerobiales bacterium]
MKNNLSKLGLIFLILLFSSVGIIADTFYTVKSGDSLWTISHNHDISIEEIVEMNNLKNISDIQVGQSLKVAEGNNQSNDQSSYTVKTGDLLWKIAQDFDVKIQDIIELNNLKAPDFYIYIGQTLLIPGQEEVSEPAASYFIYPLKPGDILWNIAQEFNTTVKELVELNEIRNAYDLYVGRELRIPLNQSDDNEIVDEKENENNNNNNNSNYVPYLFYRVNQDDNIWRIAKIFGISTRNLMRYNGMNSTRDLEVDDILIIPLENSNNNGLTSVINNNKRVNNSYRVLRNETLADIAEFYGIPEEGIRALNNMTANEEVYTGQRLKMPINPAHFNEHKMHRVAADGEYIFDIAYNHGVSIRSILKANYLRDNNIRFEEGTAVLIPQDNNSKATWIDYENGREINSWLGNRR